MSPYETESCPRSGAVIVRPTGRPAGPPPRGWTRGWRRSPNPGSLAVRALALGPPDGGVGRRADGQLRGRARRTARDAPRARAGALPGSSSSSAISAPASYMDGDWTVDDLPRFIELVLRNSRALFPARLVDLAADERRQ